MDLWKCSASQLQAYLARREISSEELLRATLARIKAVDGQVAAFLSYNEEDALAQARASDQRRAAGQALGPLEGIPIGIKDLIAVKGHPLSCASKILKGYVSPYDATVITRLRAQGAVIFGRLNMDEFGMGTSTENSGYQPTRNPWHLDYVPGGSSGGSAAAVAAGMAPLTLGSDTGGSCRQPASLCGVVGFKPTYGRVSRYGLAAYASSLDVIGSFAHTVEDIALLLQATAGVDSFDSTSYPAEVPDYLSALQNTEGKEKKSFRLGVPHEYFAEGLDAEVRASVEAAIEYYKKQGHAIIPISLPRLGLGIPTYYVIATAEASSNLARYDGVRYGYRSPHATDAIDLYGKTRAEGFGPEVKRRIILGTYVLSAGYYDAYYLKAQKVRTLIRNDFLKAFKEVDAVICPTSPTPAFRLGEKSNDPLSLYLADIYTVSVNLAGLPAISVPCGFTQGGLPIGLQLIGRPFDEAGLFAIAHAFDKAHQLGLKEPKL